MLAMRRRIRPSSWSPVLVAIAAKPVAGIIVPFICKPHSDPVVAERPHFLDQPIIELAIPFAREKRLNRLAALNELGAVAPDAIDGIAKGDAGGIAAVQASSARRAFCAAVSAVNGGSGGRGID
jgi:hypothetical protein